MRARSDLEISDGQSLEGPSADLGESSEYYFQPPPRALPDPRRGAVAVRACAAARVLPLRC